MAAVSGTTLASGRSRGWAGICLALFLAAACSESEKRLVGLSFEPAPPNVVDAGTTLQLSVVGTYDDGSSKDLSAAVAWTVSDPSVAMVAPGGRFEAGWAGPVTVTAEASGISATASLRVAGLAMLDVAPLDAPTAAYLDGPAAVLDGRGAAIVAYGMFGPSGRTLVTRTAGTEWPAAWGELDDGISDSWQTSGPDVELAASSSGVVGMLYRRTADGSNGSNLSYGIAYHDGSAWKWNTAVQGEVTWPDVEGTPSIAADPGGTLFVGYRSCAATYPLDELSVARFDASGLVDVKTWAENVTRIYVAADGTGQVMVLNEWTGSRLYDGQAWGALEPLPQRVAPGARLFLADDGTATLFELEGAVRVLHRDGSGWSPAEKLSGQASPWSAAAATDGAGHAVAAWSVPTLTDGMVDGGGELVARVFDGSSWSPGKVLDSFPPPNGGLGTSLRRVRVVTDGAGRYVVLWYLGYTQRAAWFDGAWHTAVNLAPGRVFEPQVMMRPDGKLVLISDRDVNNALFATTYALLP